MLHKLKSACFIRKKPNSEQVRLQVFRKSRWTNRQVPQFDRQLLELDNSLRIRRFQLLDRHLANWTELRRTIIKLKRQAIF